jgi:hypothetical protein
MPGTTTFDIKHGDDFIRVHVTDGVAVFWVVSIDDVGIVIEALNLAVAAGATSGSLFTGPVVNDQVAAMHALGAQTGTTWLGVA